MPKERESIALFTVFSLFFWLNFAGAVGMGVKPKAFDLATAIGREVKTQLLVINISTQPAVYQVLVDNYQKNFSFVPESFRLEVGQTQVVNVNFRFFRPGIYQTDISVVSRPL